jgi:uncharacterized MnhB-related membrane protein
MTRSAVAGFVRRRWGGLVIMIGFIALHALLGFYTWLVRDVVMAGALVGALWWWDSRQKRQVGE